MVRGEEKAATTAVAGEGERSGWWWWRARIRGQGRA